MTKPTPRKMRDEDGRIHDEYAACTLAGCVPVEPEPSRSVQRRVAIQKGESMPTFEPQETPELCSDCHHPKDDPTMHLDAPGANWSSAMHWFRAAEPQPEMPQLLIGKPCPTCGREVRPPFGPGDYSCAACGFGMVEPCEHWKNAEGGTEELEETDTASPSRAIPEAELQRVAEEIAEDAVFGQAQSENHRQTLLRLKSQRYLAILRTLEKKA